MCPTDILVHCTPPLSGEEFTVLGQGGYTCFQGVNIPITGWLHKPLTQIELVQLAFLYHTTPVCLSHYQESTTDYY